MINSGIILRFKLNKNYWNKFGVDTSAAFNAKWI